MTTPGDLFESVASSAAAAGSIRAVGGAADLSYSELVSVIASGAKALSGSASGRAAVAVEVRSRKNQWEALLIAAAADRTSVPIDNAWPAAQLRSAVAAAGCGIVITDAPADSRLAQVSGPSLHWQSLGDRLWAAGLAGNDDVDVSDDLYVLHTSGSTGRPKGVLMPAAAALAHAESVVDWLEITADDHVLQFASMVFDTSQEEIWPTLLAGAQLVTMDAELPGFSRLVRTIAAARVSVLELPTGYWRAWAAGIRNLAISLPSLRLVVIGGEAAFARDATTWRSGPLGHVRLINSYGPTEAGITTTGYEVPPEFADQSLAPLPIGFGLPSRVLRVQADDEGRDELLIGGPTLARGYLERPEETARAFVEFEDQRFYRSGDVVQRGSGGLLTFHGRRDRQVKIRGSRVELDAVEAQLRCLQGVADAQVLAGRSVRGDTELVALLATADGAPLAVDGVRAELGGTVADPMIPRRFYTVPKLPRTAAGKPDISWGRELAAEVFVGLDFAQ